MPRRLLLPLLALLLFLPAALAGADDDPFPRLSGRVVDEAEILSAAAEERLVALLAGHEAATGNQVVVVTLSSLRGLDIADYGRRLGNAWGIGEAERDNGVLLIVAPAERAVRIEVGAGLESTLTDTTSRLIIEREIQPAVAAGDLEGGVLRGAEAILAALGGGYLPPPAPRGNDLGVIVVGALAVGFLCAVVWALFAGIGRLVGPGRSVTGGETPRLRLTSTPAGSGGFSGGGGTFRGGGASGRW